MASYSIAQAKDQLPSLVKRVEAGERVVITRRGTPVAEMTPPTPELPKRTPEEIRRMDEEMKARRDARPPVSIDSVALFDLMYEGGEA